VKSVEVILLALTAGLYRIVVVSRPRVRVGGSRCKGSLLSKHSAARQTSFTVDNLV
jgi:hypothetical protein